MFCILYVVAKLRVYFFGYGFVLLSRITCFHWGSIICRIIVNFGCCQYRYSIDELLSESDRSTMLRVLNFHPRKSEKFGIGPQDIKVCVLAWGGFDVWSKFILFLVPMCIKVCVLVWRRFGYAVKVYFVSSWFLLMYLKVMYIKLECTLNFTVGKFFYILSEENYIYSPLKMLLWERYFFFLCYFIMNIYTLLNLMNSVEPWKQV